MSPRAVVVGGSGGIGQATVDLLLASNWQVTNADINSAVESSDATYLKMDVTSTSSVRSVLKEAHSIMGGIDSVIVCAGIIDPKPTSEVLDESWNKMISVHLTGSFILARESRKYLCKSKQATIVLVSSISAHLGMPRRASYSAAKGGIEALARTLAVEWAGDGIRVNVIAPGYTKTALVAAAFADGRADESAILSHIPLNRLADPIEMGRVIKFLASEDSSFITGQTILVDGGMGIYSNW
jgi:NAD(P)-dependent dehydrogenase (short-subunit alcohol dehydrogenase family)